MTALRGTTSHAGPGRSGCVSRHFITPLLNEYMYLLMVVFFGLLMSRCEIALLWVPAESLNTARREMAAWRPRRLRIRALTDRYCTRKNNFSSWSCMGRLGWWESQVFREHAERNPLQLPRVATAPHLDPVVGKVFQAAFGAAQWEEAKPW